MLMLVQQSDRLGYRSLSATAMCSRFSDVPEEGSEILLDN